jgi:hypothetical protein
MFAAATMANSDLVVSGVFTTAGGVPANSLARHDGTAWSGFGSGPAMNNPALQPFVETLTPLPSGDLVVGGRFDSFDGVPARNIARWNGVSWSALGIGLDDRVLDIVPWGHGELIAVGFFAMAGATSVSRVARWNGSTWLPLGLGLNASAAAALPLPDGSLVVGGSFSTAGGLPANRVARWNGTAWSALGSGTDNTVSALARLPDGSIVAGGTFTFADGMPASRVARWNGSNWSAMGGGPNGDVNSLVNLPDGDLLVGGSFQAVNGAPFRRIARWSAGSWSGFGTGLDSNLAGITVLPDGDVVIVGDFSEADGLVSARLARLSTTCPASVLPFASGCPSSGGGNLLTVTALPWVDSYFRSRATGMPSHAWVLPIVGFTPVAPIPLSSLLPMGVPGCDLNVTDDILQSFMTTTGQLDWEAFVPELPPIIGMQFFHQMVVIELDVSNAFVAFTSTNTLELTAGKF